MEKCPDCTAGERPLLMTSVNAAELLKEDEEELGHCCLKVSFFFGFRGLSDYSEGVGSGSAHHDICPHGANI